MKEDIEELRANVERTEMAGLTFIATRAACARAALDYIAQLEQTSRAQRTTEGKVNSAAAPAAGQAGLAKLQRYDHLGCLMAPDATGDYYAVADVEAFLATRAAPVAADTEQAIPEGYALVPLKVTNEMQRAYFKVIDENMLRVQTSPHFGRWDNMALAYKAMLAAAPAAPLATPADAGAGLTDERALFEKSEPDANLERDGDYYVNPCTQSAWDGWQARARLSTPGAPVTASEPVVVNGRIARRESIADNHDAMIILTQDFPRADKIRIVDAHTERNVAAALAAVSQSPAPVTAEPVAKFDEKHFHKLVMNVSNASYRCGRHATDADGAIDLHHEANEADQAIIDYANSVFAPAPADRDAIRNEALEEAARRVEERASNIAPVELIGAVRHETATNVITNVAAAIRALKSMVRAADAKGEQQ